MPPGSSNTSDTPGMASAGAGSKPFSAPPLRGFMRTAAWIMPGRLTSIP